jgi:hypothetical protein
MKLKVPNYVIIGSVLGLFALGFLLSLNVGIMKSFGSEKASDLETKFALLSNAGTNFCAGPDFIGLMPDGESLQGSCCSPMDFHRYTEQVEGLKKYSHISIIPSDPYDISVSWAGKMLDYKDTIELTVEQQEIYDDAMEMSHEGGPCCCKCWRWYAYEGLAKYLITEYDFDSHQIAEVWDLSDGCGGSGHTHDEMHSEVDEV